MRAKFERRLLGATFVISFFLMPAAGFAQFYDPARPHDPSVPSEDYLTTEQMRNDPWVIRKNAECSRNLARSCGELGREYSSQRYVDNHSALALHFAERGCKLKDSQACIHAAKLRELAAEAAAASAEGSGESYSERRAREKAECWRRMGLAGQNYCNL